MMLRVDHVTKQFGKRAAVDKVSLELGRGDRLTSPQLPGFELPLDALFGPKPAAG